MHPSAAATAVRHWLASPVLCAGVLLAAMVGAAQAAPIVVGQVAPLSGLKASDGRGYSAGMQMYFNHVNKAGGINGNTLVLARKDD